MLTAFAEIGVRLNPDYNRADQTGAFYYQTTMAKGRRCSAADAYLRPVVDRTNLTVLTGVHCNRVVFDGKRAAGIELDRAGAGQIVHARREVILATGAYHSPKLLMLSGHRPGRAPGRTGYSGAARLPGAWRTYRRITSSFAVSQLAIQILRRRLTASPIRGQRSMRWRVFSAIETPDPQPSMIATKPAPRSPWNRVVSAYAPIIPIT